MKDSKKKRYAGPLPENLPLQGDVTEEFILHFSDEEKGPRLPESPEEDAVLPRVLEDDGDEEEKVPAPAPKPAHKPIRPPRAAAKAEKSQKAAFSEPAPAPEPAFFAPEPESQPETAVFEPESQPEPAFSVPDPVPEPVKPPRTEVETKKNPKASFSEPDPAPEPAFFAPEPESQSEPAFSAPEPAPEPIRPPRTADEAEKNPEAAVSPSPFPDPVPGEEQEKETPEKSAEAEEMTADTDDKPAEIRGPKAFYASLAALRAEDIAPKTKKSPADRLRALVRPTALLLLAAVFFYAAYTVVFNMITYSIADERYQQLAGNFSMESTAGTDPLLYADDVVPLPDFAGMLSGNFEYKEVVSPEDGAAAVYRAKLAMLKERNPDTFGWIIIDGTNINYPLVQGSDNDFYLDHDFSGAYYTVGSIFVDYRCEQEMLMNPNLVIYGHNIRTRGIMFNQLLRYTDRSFFDSHPEIKIYTPDGLYIYEIFAFFQTTADAGYANVYFYGDEDFVSYGKRIWGMSWYPREGVTEESFQPETRLLTLSTCTNGEASERYAVVARLKEIKGS